MVTQPAFLAHRGDDYLRDVHPGLCRCASLLDVGVPLARSSDAPYAPFDSRTVIAATVHRRTPADQVAGPGERLTPAAALDAYLAPPDDPAGPPCRIRPGVPADLVLLERPLTAALGNPRADAVRAVFVAG